MVAVEQLRVNMIIDGVNYPVGMVVSQEFKNKLPNHLRRREHFEPARVETEEALAVEEFPLEGEDLGP
jgi:hypothetical protein